ncbi:Uncharacterised protein r2_g3529 [Pycnogonum litorale]
MDKAIQKKRKGGAAKERDRKKKKLTISASKCRNLVDLFKGTNTGCGEVSEHGDKDTQSVAVPSAAESVDDILAAESVAGCGVLLTLPVSKVACERSFSALKRIKNRLRSTMTQEHLEAFMLMSVEKRILAKLDTKNIIDGAAARSSELRRLILS